MTLKCIPARLAALLAGGALVMSCDTRSTIVGPPILDNGDVTPPTLSLVLSAGVNNIVDVGMPLKVTVTATDNVGVATLNTTLSNGATVIGADTVTLKPTVTSEVRVVPVPTAGLQRGDKIVIRATAVDGSLNGLTDSLIVTIADTTVPAMTIFSSKAAHTLKGGDSLDVRVTAADSAGIQKTGYRVYRTGGPDSLTVVIGDSVAAAAGTTTTSLTGSFNRVLPTALPIGTYRVVGFALDRSGLAPNPGPSVSFSVVDGEPPQLTFIAPKTGATVNVGDSMLVRVNLHDNVGLKSVTFYAVSPRGDASLGTADTVMRYAPVTAPQGKTAAFRTGLTDTLDLRRYLKPVTPLDTIPGKLILYGVVTDAAGNVTTDTAIIQMTKGPNVSLVAPIGTDSLTRGTKLRIIVSAASGVGITKLGFDVASGAAGPAWPTPILKTFDTTFSTPPLKTGPYSVDIDIPADAPSLGMLTISPHATDVNGQPGAPTPQDFFVRIGAAPPPFVRQQIASRIELKDSVTIYASGAALTQVGYIIRDILNPNTRVDSNSVTASSSSFGPQGITFTLATQWQGKRVSISAFARDSAGKIGWAVPAGSTTPVTDTTKMARDTALVVYGQTFALPRIGVAGDLSVDSARGSVYISNTMYNRLERWNAATGSFDPAGVAVGSEPWGMVLQIDNDTLLVANSGGTNISKVCVNPTTCTGGIGEVLARRIQTRNTIVQNVTQSIAPNGRVSLSLGPPISYSDRPQYVQQSAGGRLFYSTRPTTYAPAGTIRWLDPTLPVPDPRQVYQYAEKTPDNTYAVFNADSIALVKFLDPNKSDELIIFDHIYGQKIGGSCTAVQTDGSTATVANTICGRDSVVMAAVNKVNALGGDVDARLDIDITLLGLTDTTFVASSGDRSWIGFGEGNKAGVGRVMMVNDLAGDPKPRFFSPGITVSDLLENASEPVFGMGLDRYGSTVAVHGAQSYFATVEDPFHLRLQGKYDTFDTGAGVTFHPNADLRSAFITSGRTDSTRTAFVASANGSIEVVDAAFFISRGTLQIKNNLYGPLRASLPFATDNQGVLPTDPNYVVLKLFGLTKNGLVVINLRASDIQPVP
jgi:hypothetical protein